ncbi:unnamed protein product [Penicillium roqueforti FM164]|uniref:Protein kinase domain-containing protein n=1 Tax=Penicillium roqueforti (strain FM164) TaxID=1365484 RepID=W6QQ10_PENRF|nr:unnamed protein product [Penicillium roqueforti FM164]
MKTASLLTYIDRNLKKQIAREVETYKILCKNPHPNIATYHSYKDTRGQVSRLYFRRYTLTLLKAVNP